MGFVPIILDMDIATLELKIAEYQARDDELVARLSAATNDTQRFDIERMRRLVQVALSGFVQIWSHRHLAERTPCGD